MGSFCNRRCVGGMGLKTAHLAIGFVLSKPCCRYILPLGSFGNRRSTGRMERKTAQLTIGFVSQLRYEAIGLFAKDDQGRIGFPRASGAAEFEAGLPRIKGSGDDLPDSLSCLGPVSSRSVKE